MNLSLGLKIKELRKAHGLNQTQMADKLGVHLQTLSRYERDKLVPGPEVLSVLAEKFNLDANSLLRDENLAVTEEAPAWSSSDAMAICKMLHEVTRGMTKQDLCKILEYARERKMLAELLKIKGVKNEDFD
jgi:transcriptional regulator with XRE-family HTH domain